nr:hypothetical protein [Tanacetum cinerariifolium]
MEQPDLPEAAPQSLIQTPPVPHDEDERKPMFMQPHDPNYIPEPMYHEYIPLEDEHVLPAEEQPLPPVVSPTVESPEYVAESDPEEDPEEYEDDETEDGSVDYPMDGGDDEDDDDGDSSRDDADDEEEDKEEEKEEEEHLAPADSAIVIPTDELVSPPKKTKPVIPPPSTDTTTTGAKITVELQAAISLPSEAEVERLLAMPTSPPSLLASLSPPFVGERLARDDVPETEMPPRKSTLDAEARRRGIGEVGYGIRDTWVDPAETVLEIAPMTVGEAELLALREQPRRASQPGGDARVPDHQDAPRDTDKSVQAMIDQALLRNFTNGDERHSSHDDNRRNMQTACPCFYADFMKCQPLNFKGTEGVVGLTQWIEKMELVFQISGCAVENQGEIKKLEIELWNLKVKGNDVPAYTEHFQELTLICTKFVANETEKIDKYVNGLPDNIYGSVKASKPKTLDETIELANDLMDQKLRTYAERQTNKKRKADDSFRNNLGHQQQPLKRKTVTRVYNMGTSEKKPYSGNLPKCTKCHFHHNGPCTQKCHKCNKVGHFSCDCRSSSNANVANAQRNNEANLKGNGSFKCGAPGHFKRDCPKCHAVIVYDEKLVRVPYGNETLIFRSNKSNNWRKSRLIVISCSKAQEYMAKGCQIFLAHKSAKKEEDKSKGKQLKDVPIIQDFPKVFPEDLLGLSPTRPVEFQIDLILGAAPVARAPYRLAPTEMKELSKQLQEISDKGFIRPSLAGYYRRFIEGFSKIAKSMTKLIKKRIKFDWGEKEENAFKLIKQKLCSAPILALPEGSKDFVAEVGEAQLTGPELIQETTEKIILIKLGIQAAQDRQKSYADLKRKPMELELPQELSSVHHTFHVSNLKNCYADERLVMSLEGIHVDDKLQFVEEPVEIIEREIK